MREVMTMKIRKLITILMLTGILAIAGCEEKAEENPSKTEQQEQIDDKEVLEEEADQEPETEPEFNVEEVRSVIIGTWGNDYAFSDDEIMAFSMAYHTQFLKDGTVVQTGYRNTDSGTYEILDEHTVKATFDHNCYEDPADPDDHDPIENYVYTVEYKLNDEDGSMYATYSENFHQLVMSNAADGILRREE